MENLTSAQEDLILEQLREDRRIEYGEKVIENYDNLKSGGYTNDK